MSIQKTGTASTVRAGSVIALALLFCGCTAFLLGYEQSVYTTLGWLRVDPGEIALLTGYKRLQQEMGFSLAVKQHVAKHGLPDYLNVPRYSRLYLGHTADGLIYELDSSTTGCVIAKHDWRKFSGLTPGMRTAFAAHSRSFDAPIKHAAGKPQKHKPPLVKGKPPKHKPPLVTHMPPKPKSPRVTHMPPKPKPPLVTNKPPKRKQLPVETEPQTVAAPADAAEPEEPVPTPGPTVADTTTELPTTGTMPPSVNNEPVVREGSGRYHALVIGIDKYQHLPQLTTAKNDAFAVAQVLSAQYGFAVENLLDATRADILQALGRCRKALKTTDNLLIYYAGHGWLDGQADEGYWLPVDATRQDEVNWIANSAVTAAIRAINANHILIVADSCYSGKLARGLRVVRKDPDYLQRMSSKKSRVVLCSGGLEPVVDAGGKGNHSVFAAAFLAALRENKDVLDGTSLYNKLRRPVMLNSDQTPDYSDIRKAGHEGGDFVFVPLQDKK